MRRSSSTRPCASATAATTSGGSRPPNRGTSEASALEYFEQIDTRGFYRPRGRATFEQAIEMVASAMVHARECGCRDLLVNAYGLVGLESPNIFTRYNLAVRWAESAGSQLRVAMVAAAELIDPEKIAITMAQNRGVTGDVFTNEAEALSWLNARQSTPLR